MKCCAEATRLQGPVQIDRLDVPVDQTYLTLTGEDQW